MLECAGKCSLKENTKKKKPVDLFWFWKQLIPVLGMDGRKATRFERGSDQANAVQQVQAAGQGSPPLGPHDAAEPTVSEAPW